MGSENLLIPRERIEARILKYLCAFARGTYAG